MNAKDLTDDALGLIAARFKLMGEASRLKIIIALEDGEQSVGEIVLATGLTQANASRHLAALTAGGILGRRRDGLNVRYAIIDPTVFEICETVCGSLQKGLGGRAESLGKPSK